VPGGGSTRARDEARTRPIRTREDRFVAAPAAERQSTKPATRIRAVHSSQPGEVELARLRPQKNAAQRIGRIFATEQPDHVTHAEELGTS
jgi:hypothetical protein